MSIQTRLAQAAAVNVQKDKASAFISVLNDVISSAKISDLSLLLNTVVNDSQAGGPVVARPVLAELVKNLKDGRVGDSSARAEMIRGALEIIQPRGVTYEEQVAGLRYQLADILEEDEEWKEAAKALTGINFDASHSDEDKLKVYIRIVRLLLEDEESGQAETYYNRAASLIHLTDSKELQLSFKLCQARILDYSRKFVEAATRYHELSWVADIDEDERAHALSAAVTCAVLAPAGPPRARVLASLYRDERSASLPNYTILSKMFNDHIIRSAEIKDFEKTLKPHQLAKIAQSSNDRLAARVSADEPSGITDPDAPISTRTGPSTVLDSAVMQHNLLSCSKIYNNITFSGLGALLDLTPGAAETMARKMIEQKRLRGSLDQVERLIWFETRNEDEDAQGKAGGLGDVDQEEEDTGAPGTKKWDMQIRQTASNVESIVQRLADKGLVPPHGSVMITS